MALGLALLVAGVRAVVGSFTTGDTVEIATADGTVFAKGIVAADAETVESLLGKRSGDLPPDTPAAVVHRDDLVVLP